MAWKGGRDFFRLGGDSTRLNLIIIDSTELGGRSPDSPLPLMVSTYNDWSRTSLKSGEATIKRDSFSNSKLEFITKINQLYFRFAKIGSLSPWWWIELNSGFSSWSQPSVPSVSSWMLRTYSSSLIRIKSSIFIAGSRGRYLYSLSAQNDA